MDVNGRGSFQPTLKSRADVWPLDRQSGRELILLTTHQTQRQSFSSRCQVPEDGNYPRIHLKSRRTIRRKQALPSTSSFMSVSVKAYITFP